MDDRIALLQHQVRLGYDVRSWHGPNLLGSLRGVTIDAACYRPQRGRHNIWEIVVHCAYWKYRACRLLGSDSTRPFELKGSDWFERPVARTDRVWRQDLKLLGEWQTALLDAVERTDSRTLDAARGRFTTAELISGITAHDLYHAGQIRLLRRLYDAVPRRQAMGRD
jgi:uncharacterized damage-inducible protein DinB